MTFHTISGFEAFGDNQFATPITAFPVLRNQQKYQVRYDLSHSSGRHALKFGINLIQEPVLSGALAGTDETLIQYANDPSFYVRNPAQFYFSPQCLAGRPNDGSTCTFMPTQNGSFSQSVRRFGVYVQDSLRPTSQLTLNYGLRYDTTFGLFEASGRTQSQNPALLTLRALGIPLANGEPHEYRKQFGPRLGIAYSPGRSETTVIRAGIGLYYNDLAQNGWVPAFQALNSPPGVCVNPGDPGCIPGGGHGALIDPNYKSPYALHASTGIQRVLNKWWTLSADWTHENGVHAYRGYSYTAGINLFSPNPADQKLVPNVDVYRTDNRSSYDAMTIRLQGDMQRLNVTAHYTLATAKTWGCTVGELFDYVNGVCDPLNPFAPGNYGPSGEDVRHRFVLVGRWLAPLGLEVSSLTQVESARPFTLANGTDRAVINGRKTTLDEFRGTPFAQVDLRVSRPIRMSERWSVVPFVEFFNLFNRNNPANNFVADVAAFNVPSDQIAAGNVTDLCGNANCSELIPITSLNQLRKPAGALGDFFGPGTTVGIPFAAQWGVRATF